MHSALPCVLCALAAKLLINIIVLPCPLPTAGEVPNLFAKDELVSVMESVTPRAKRAGKALTLAGLWDFFLDSVRVNLHLVLTMSPVGGAFRERLRK